jgi:hypothetical protein
MLKAYLRRYDGATQPVTVRHQGQHLGVHEGKVRFARLYWERSDPKAGGGEDGYAALEEAVPLLDTLIITRVSPRNGERAVFHGILTEVSSDERLLSLVAVDNPATERLYDQPWWNDAPLHPSDQAAPEHTQPFASVSGAQPAQGGAQTLAGVPVGQGAHLRAAPAPQSADPAARPGGHPAAPPAGSWQASPQPAAQQA